MEVGQFVLIDGVKYEIVSIAEAIAREDKKFLAELKRDLKEHYTIPKPPPYWRGRRSNGLIDFGLLSFLEGASERLDLA